MYIFVVFYIDRKSNKDFENQKREQSGSLQESQNYALECYINKYKNAY